MVKLLLSKGADIDLAVIDNGHLRNNSNADAYAIIEAVVDGGAYESFTRAHRHFLCRGVGEVWIRGPTLFSGRGNDVEATAEAITADGWFRTDDLVKVDGDGYLTVLDRATDMIVVCSENVYRLGVERVLDGHPGGAALPTPATKLRLALAGAADDGAAALTWDRFADVLKPKVDGSLHLHAASLKTPVDTFDGLAAARARAGLPALAVSWGTWADAGMAHRFGSGFEAHVKSTGMRFVPLDGGFQALAALSQVAGRTQCHAAVLPADWAQYAKRAPRACTRRRRRAAAAPLRARRGPPRELAAAAPADRAAMLASRVAAHVAEMMELAPRPPSVGLRLSEAAVLRPTPATGGTADDTAFDDDHFGTSPRSGRTRRPGAANERPPCRRARGESYP
ncbi:Acyl-CoA synthetase (AMP-forming) AMP-acid ligase II [Aureococcus anophagefferens]|nr:Acyl-CoA synthetase (AMP-forming) AMP-acid ligase II [Aureococcus anophagefferens]